MSTTRNRKGSTPSAIPRSLHSDVVRSFLLHHCEDFDWQQRALGLLRSKSIKLLIDLADDVENDELRVLNSDSHTVVRDAQRFLRARQFKALVSKYQYSKDLVDLAPETRALENFLKAERRNRRLNALFRGHFHRGTERHWSIPIVRKYFQRALGERPFIERILDGCDFSGGASTMHSGAKTHLARKLGASEIQGGDGALYYFHEAIWRNSSYSEQFLPRGAINKEIVCLDRVFLREKIDALWKQCQYNEIKVVPKNAKSGRTIAKEPPGNNLVQKGIDEEMRHLLKRAYGIDLRHQEPNQLLALHGSVLDVADPYVTIDVKDASNSVITWLVRSLANPFWFELLNRTRSQNYRLPGEQGLRSYELFCSMGNGFCFPLETHIFAAICSAAYEHCGMKADFRCYGDDIVVRQSVALVTIEILNACGFRVNVDKTFIHGPFRESCGANWYGGLDVTPGYYKDPIVNRAGLYAQHNSLHKWPILQVLLRSVLPKHHIVDDTKHYAWVSNQAFRVPLDVAMTHPDTRWEPDIMNFSYKILVSSPDPDGDWETCFMGNSPERMRVTAAYRGSTFDEPFHLRFSTTSRTVRTSEWDGVKPTAQVAEWTRNHAKACEGPRLRRVKLISPWERVAR